MKEIPTYTVSDRTRRAVQDYTALNTIISAMEAFHEFRDDPMARAVLEAFTSDECEHESVRLPIACPLGRRALDVGMLRTSSRGTRGVLERRARL